MCVCALRKPWLLRRMPHRLDRMSRLLGHKLVVCADGGPSEHTHPQTAASGRDVHEPVVYSTQRGHLRVQGRHQRISLNMSLWFCGQEKRIWG